MAHKKELSEQEKVAEILKRANVAFDPAKAEAHIALNTRCKRCGRTLSSLERITFENKCEACMQVESKEKRDKFVRKYIIIAFAFIIAIVLGGYCANSGSDAWRIVGVVVSGVVTCISIGYVLYTNIDKILPSLQTKYQIWVVCAFALGIAFVISLLTYLSKSWILYIVLMLAVSAYVFYVAYGELMRLKERANLLDVYSRKARDKEYVESITEAIEARAQKEETEPHEESQAPEVFKEIELPPDFAAFVAEKAEKTAKTIKHEHKRKPSDEKTEGNVENITSTDNQQLAEPAAEEPKDSGDFMI